MPNRPIYGPGVPVIFAHQHRGLLRERVLRLEAQHVLVASAEFMQADPHTSQERQCPFERRDALVRLGDARDGSNFLAATSTRPVFGSVKSLRKVRASGQAPAPAAR